MAVSENFVLIFKSESKEENDPYEQEFLKNGFKTKVLNIITFKYINIGELNLKIQNPDNYSGLIFTSERCVIGVQLTNCDIKTWENKIILCTGETTQRTIKQLLNLNAKIGEKQRVDGIVELIQKENFVIDKPLLYPCSNLADKNDNLRSSLEKNSIKCESIITYETLPNTNLLNDINEIFSKKENEWPNILVFFSPSGFNSAIKYLKELNLNDKLSSFKFVAIGPTTAEEIRNNNYTVWAEASLPKPQALVQSVIDTLKTDI